MEKPPCVEIGRPLNWCARSLHEQQIQGRMSLPAEWWPGWKIQQGKLIGPGGMRFTPAMLSALWRLNGRALRNLESGITPDGSCLTSA